MKTVAINYFAVILAAVFNMVLGIIWYGPLFGKQWKEWQEFTDESLKARKISASRAMLAGLGVAVIMSYVLAHSLVYSGTYFEVHGIAAGLMAGFWNWLGFIVPVTAGVVLWEGKSVKLWVLNSSYWLVALLVMGCILSVGR